MGCVGENGGILVNSLSAKRQTGWATEAVAWAKRATGAAHRQGVRITTGTDWFEPTERGALPNTHEEMALLVHAAGLTPLEAITAATKTWKARSIRSASKWTGRVRGW